MHVLEAPQRCHGMTDRVLGLPGGGGARVFAGDLHNRGHVLPLGCIRP